MFLVCNQPHCRVITKGTIAGFSLPLPLDTYLGSGIAALSLVLFQHPTHRIAYTLCGNTIPVILGESQSVCISDRFREHQSQIPLPKIHSARRRLRTADTVSMMLLGSLVAWFGGRGPRGIGSWQGGPGGAPERPAGPGRTKNGAHQQGEGWCPVVCLSIPARWKGWE